MPVSEELLKELGDIYERLRNQGLLIPQDQLDSYHGTFRAHFAPERLAELDGEALLDKMHNQSNRDSLVYWLEFKNDEEFPSGFGSIGGGSALKFGIFRRRETGEWVTGSPTQQRALSTEEAILYVRKYRDQLIAGSQLLEKLPQNTTDEGYQLLQNEIDEVAPDIGNTSWVHKYFGLLYPDKLDTFHAVNFQHYNLIKLLQVPPTGRGRYLAAGRYLEIASALGIPTNILCDVLFNRNGRPHKYWRIGTTDGTLRRNRWDLMRDGNFVAIGWDKLDDLSAIVRDRDSKEMVRGRFELEYPNSPSQIGRNTQQAFSFVTGIEEGDVVAACDGETVLGVGTITGDYFYDPSSDFPHRRPVDWVSFKEWRLPHAEGLQSSVRPLNRYPENLVAIEKQILEPQSPPEPPPNTPPPTFRLTGVPGRIQSVLDRKGQVILYGPPGTGKTYWAETACRELASRFNLGKPFDALSEEQKSSLSSQGDNLAGYVRMCTFHPGYGYEDFLEGYRPDAVNDRLAFSLRDGLFKRLCSDAQDRPDRRFYLIVDEINRGDIPRIFGELLSVMEWDKRGKSVMLPLSGSSFRVPSNVYLVGTMNTADRSIALLDTALRRRFGFVELMPDSSILGSSVVDGIPLALWLDSLNDRVREFLGRDARNLQVGHSYLMEGGKPISDFVRFARVVRGDVIPLLEEYCYEDYSTLERILGNGLIDSNRQRIREELFEDARRDDLVQALLAPDPDLIASTQAITSDGIETEVNEDDSDDSE